MDSGPTLHAYVSFRDAEAGLRWLEHVGFTTVTRQDDRAGNVLHAEVRLGDAVIMVASADAAYTVPPLVGTSTGGGLYLWLPDPSAVDDWCSRAVAAGGQLVIAPEETGWGTRRCRVLDPEGHEWSVGTYRPASS